MHACIIKKVCTPTSKISGWDFVHWDFVRLGFCPVGILSVGILSGWDFVHWDFVLAPSSQGVVLILGVSQDVLCRT